MPRQEVFLEKTIGNRRIEVLKTYDVTSARDAFSGTDMAARKLLWNSLALDGQDEVPDLDSAEGEDVLWDALLEDSREDGNLLSFFLVTETNGKDQKIAYVSADWPSAEHYAQKLLQESARSQ
jgi:hypothetical protein